MRIEEKKKEKHELEVKNRAIQELAKKIDKFD